MFQTGDGILRERKNDFMREMCNVEIRYEQT